MATTLPSVPPTAPRYISQGFGILVKNGDLGLWVHSSELVLRHTVELEESVGLV